MLDSMICADCIGNPPFSGKENISRMKSGIDISSSKQGDTKSSTDSKQSNKIFCSTCAGSVLGVEINSPQAPVQVVQRVDTYIKSPFSELHYSIHKPPPNSLV
jgi:hypothetical protein